MKRFLFACIIFGVMGIMAPAQKRVGDTGLILKPPQNPEYWSYKPSNGVTNPAFLEHPGGGYFLYFKSEKGKMGVAIAQNPEGPYFQLPFPVTQNDQTVEDGYAFVMDGKICLLTTDHHGILEEGGGILWTSDDGLKFDTYEKGFHRINAHTEVDMSKVAVHYGLKNKKYAKHERLQILMIDGKPQYFYAASGCNIYGGKNTVSYVLKRKQEGASK